MPNITRKNLISALMALHEPDRRLDSLAMAILAAPPAAELDSEAGLDGWDIMLDGEVWMPAEDIPYATYSVDAAIEICAQGLTDPNAAILRGIASIGARFSAQPMRSDLAGYIARHVLAEAVAAGVGVDESLAA